MLPIEIKRNMIFSFFNFFMIKRISFVFLKFIQSESYGEDIKKYIIREKYYQSKKI